MCRHVNQKTKRNNEKKSAERVDSNYSSFSEIILSPLTITHRSDWYPSVEAISKIRCGCKKKKTNAHVSLSHTLFPSNTTPIFDSRFFLPSPSTFNPSERSHRSFYPSTEPTTSHQRDLLSKFHIDIDISTRPSWHFKFLLVSDPSWHDSLRLLWFYYIAYFSVPSFQLNHSCSYMSTIS